MLELCKTGLGIAVGVASTLFIGYCIYFDHKRRKDPEYKKKLREFRNRNRTQKNVGGKSDVPNLNDREAIERYFLQEIQLGETQIGLGNFESGVEHFANAIVFCGQPGRLLQILQTLLPAQVFAMLIVKIQELGNRAQQGAPRIVASSAGIGSESAGGAAGHVPIGELE